MRPRFTWSNANNPFLSEVSLFLIDVEVGVISQRVRRFFDTDMAPTDGYVVVDDVLEPTAVENVLGTTLHRRDGRCIVDHIFSLCQLRMITDGS